MSVSSHCRPNDIIFLIDGFYINNNEIEKSFDIGDSVYYLDWEYKDLSTNNYVIMISFRTSDGFFGKAVETYFVTEEVWVNLENYFKKKYDSLK